MVINMIVKTVSGFDFFYVYGARITVFYESDSVVVFEIENFERTDVSGT